MPRKKQVSTQPTYRVFIYRPHKSGIGSEFVREVQTLERPSFELGYWKDETNHVWAVWERDWSFSRNVCKGPRMEAV